MTKYALLIPLALVLSGCPRVCRTNEARCLGTTVQICRPDGRWATAVDCGKVDKVPWTCGCRDAKTCRCSKPLPRP